MNDKEKYYQAIKNFKGGLDEITLGDAIGLDENSTRKAISDLLLENKIEYDPNELCNYRIKKKLSKTINN